MAVFFLNYIMIIFCVSYKHLLIFVAFNLL